VPNKLRIEKFIYFYNKIKKMYDDIKLTFTNYNYAFTDFYENYKDTCLKLSDKTSIDQLVEIRKLIATFIFEYDYTLSDNVKREAYRKSLKELSIQLTEDEELKKIQNRDFSIAKNKIEYHHRYYYYFLLYLELFGRFISELTETFMPNTNIQKKHLRFSNNQIFFEKFINHKKIVLESLSEFSIMNFANCYNKMITFYYAYSLFINTADRIVIDKLFSLVISFYLEKKNLNLLLTDNLSNSQINELTGNSLVINEALLYINSMMNASFSSYDVLPKIQKKVYADRTLI